MNLPESIKLTNSKKTLATALFFSLFLANSWLVAHAQYEGGYYDYGAADYGYYEPYDYYTEYYLTAYDYQPEFYYEHYSYPYIADPGVTFYSAASYHSYNYPSISDPEVPVYQAASHQQYIYPSITDPGVPSYQSAQYGGYNYSSISDPGVPTYPSIPYTPTNYNYEPSFANYSYLTPPSTAVAHAAESISVASASTGPENALFWIFAISLTISIAVYLLLLKIRIRLQFNSGGENTILAKRIEEIRSSELMPDTNGFQI